MMPEFPFKNKLVLVNVISGVVLVIAVGTAVFFYSQYRKSVTSNSKSTAEIESTAAAVAKLMELPAENPTLATVSDVEKLKDQDFFRRAQNGDKVLIFKGAKKAILYRPFANKIIEVGPIKVEDSPAPQVAGVATESAQVVSPTIVVVSPSVTPTPSESIVSVAVYNGTKVTGLSKKTAEQLSAQFSDLKIKSTANAVNTYEKTIVIDISNKHKSKATSIASFLKGEVGSLPKGETVQDVDILVIVGAK